MRARIWQIAILLFLTSTDVALALTSDAQRLSQALSALGFQCTQLRCRGYVSSYSEPVDVFISSGFNLNQAALLAYHLHGWWTDPCETPFDGEDGDFQSFLDASHNNTLLIIPESRGKNETFERDLNTAVKMTSFFNEVEGVVAIAGVGVTPLTARALSGHSGAYVQMGRMGAWAKSGEVPHLKTLRGFALLDSAYGYHPGLVDVMDTLCQQSVSTYWLALNPNDGRIDKLETNRRIWLELNSQHTCPTQQILWIPDSETKHYAFPRKYLAAFLDAIQ
jgi:hypothetical protein